MAIPPLTVYIDSAGYAQEAPAVGVSQDQAREFSEYGGGYIDYTDNDFVNGVATTMPADEPYWVQRDLTASAANNRLNRPFSGFAFWDNADKLVRGRALFDIMQMSIAIRVVPDRIDGTLRVSLNTPTVEIGGKNMAITATVGTQEAIRADFIFPVRNSLLTNGAKIMLTPSVPMTLIECSPEFYPMGYEA